MIGYYVTVARGKRVGWLAGPFADHQQALALVPMVRDEAVRVDPWCAFDAFGTASRQGATLPRGVLHTGPEGRRSPLPTPCGGV